MARFTWCGVVSPSIEAVLQCLQSSNQWTLITDTSTPLIAGMQHVYTLGYPRLSTHQQLVFLDLDVDTVFSLLAPARQTSNICVCSTDVFFRIAWHNFDGGLSHILGYYPAAHRILHVQRLP